MSVLSRHSSVFDDLFSVPQPEEAERVENCPVVHVPDEPEDMAHLLFALYDGRRSVYVRPLATVQPLTQPVDSPWVLKALNASPSPCCLP